MTLRPSRVAALLCAAVWALVASACSSAATPEVSGCGDKPRERIDCSSEIAYQGSKTEGGFGVAGLASGGAGNETRALRRVDEETERFIAMQSRLCRDYNACVLDADTYARESKQIRERVTRIPELAAAVRSAPSETERVRAMDELYRSAVPEERRPEEVSFRFEMKAELPASAGGKRFAVAPGDMLPTGARVSFEVSVSADAHVYIFQSSPKSGLTVLFPDARIGTQNPLREGQIAAIPGGKQSFRLDDKDLGTERVFIAVSRERVANLDDALARVASGKVNALADDAVLARVGGMDEGGADKCKTRGLVLDTGTPAGCARSRGLVLDGPSEEGASIAARTEPGDDLIVKVLPFQHVAELGYTPPARARGAVIQE
jgi:hypothetical protein